VLSIGKLGRGQEQYYLNTVTRGVEDYYLGSGEAPGRWIGRGAALLGLSGVVRPDQLRAVLDGRHPTDNTSLITVRRKDRLPGFDLTFSAPKGMSLLFALGDAELSLAVRRAHDTSVAQALGYLEREAGEVLRGHNCTIRLAGGGFVAAAFRHRSSRAGDPQLHTHVLTANMARGSDGRWSALDGRQLYWQAKTAGTLYQTALRHQLRDLGLEFILRGNGQCELAGIPERVLCAFSRRRVEIEQHLAERGLHSRGAAQIAALATRKAKNYAVRPESLAAEWQARADRLGFTARVRAGLLGRVRPEPPGTAELARAAGMMLGPAGLTARASTFDRREVLRAWCQHLPHGAPVAEVEQLTDRLLSIPDVRVITEAGNPQAGRPGAVRSMRRHSTAELLALEAWVLETAAGQTGSGLACVPEPAVQGALAAFPVLSAEQRELVSRLTRSPAGVQVVVGKAGTGKTTALAAVRTAWQHAGHPVLGAAVAARAAIGLTEGAGIPAVTVARLLTEARYRGPAGAGLTPGTVLVVDEAGMLGTRQLAHLLQLTTTAHAKLVLVGDHRQLPELAAGGAFRALAHRLEAIELSINRRQTSCWERAALDELRAGEPTLAIDAYHAAGRISSQPSAREQRAALVAAWWQAAHQPSGQLDQYVLMMAGRRADVTELNRLARHQMVAAGRITGENLHTGTADGDIRTFATGDLVIARRNNYPGGLINGERGLITAIDTHANRVTIAFGGRQVTVGREYLDGAGLDHGYALTVHQAQGLTVDRAFLLGSDALYREAGYVGLSRGRHDNHLYLTHQTTSHRPTRPWNGRT
jgi:conjugative relaxase-like TrwC/TraI family protein